MQLSCGKADSKIVSGIGCRTSNSVKELVKMGRSQHPKTVLIMDEVDGMSGGVDDLIASIKISKLPIICICNDTYNKKIKSLVNNCSPLKFRNPTKHEMARRLAHIANAEGLEVNMELAERFSGDMRMAINQLQYMGLSTSVVKSGGNKQYHDVHISPFTAIEKLFGFDCATLRMDERFDLIRMSDGEEVPLMIQENYVNHKPGSAGRDDMKRMKLLALAAESIGDGDIINQQIQGYQQRQLYGVGSLASCIIPAFHMRSERGARNINRYTGWKRKRSTTLKNDRLLKALHVQFLSSRESTNLGRQTLRVEYLSLLSKKLTGPLETLPTDEAVEQVVKFMDLYSINMNDFDTIAALSIFKRDIQPEVKKALARAYEKGSSSRVIKAANFITLPGIKKVSKKHEENADELAENEDDSDEKEDKDELVDTEKLQSEVLNLNSKAMHLQVDLKGSGSSSAKKKPSGRGRGRVAGTSDVKAGHGRQSGSAAGRGHGSGSAAGRGCGSGSAGSKRKR